MFVFIYACNYTYMFIFYIFIYFQSPYFANTIAFYDGWRQKRVETFDSIYTSNTQIQALHCTGVYSNCLFFLTGRLDTMMTNNTSRKSNETGLKRYCNYLVGK